MVLMSIVDKWNELSRVAIESLNEVKELKKRDIRRLFIFIGKIIKNLKESAIQVKTNLESRIELLESRIEVLELAKKEA